MLKQHLLENVLLVLFAAFIAWLPFFLFGIVRASYLKWNVEHDRESRLRATEVANRPVLIGEIEQVMTGYSPDLGATQAFVLLAIVNHGEPSIADGFGVTVEAENVRLSERPWHIPPGYKLYGEGGKVVAEFKTDANLSTKANEPIEKGHRVRGWLQYRFKQVTADHLSQLQGPKAKWTVTFYDYLRNEYTATRQWTEADSHAQPIGEVTVK
ncbi:MAG: hypothetical protein L0312_26720 [Acidobacteria bacterium]|nr:hypothetical protein [Acidobacteriota bacterium]